jgi:uncharacterized protein
MLDPRLLEILACPACEDRPPVRQEGDGLRCDKCGRIYPILDGIPEMLVESAIESLRDESVPAPAQEGLEGSGGN